MFLGSPGDTPQGPVELECGFDDVAAESLLALWQSVFPFAQILPSIGYPSYLNAGVVTLMHDTRMFANEEMIPTTINGLQTSSPLANHALYSAECTNGTWIHLYEILLPDIPGQAGNASTVELYVRSLGDNGLHVAGVHFHWWGASKFANDKGLIAIHHQMTGSMGPLEFSNRTISALSTALNAIASKAQ